MHTADRVTLARLPSGVPVETTIHRYGDGDGPTCYVQAAQHGREINGTDVLRRLHERLTDSTAVGSVASDLDGTLIVVPVADPLTFDRVAYTTPEPIDSAAPNMNRCWPGNSAGTIHERMAAGRRERRRRHHRPSHRQPGDADPHGLSPRRRRLPESG